MNIIELVKLDAGPKAVRGFDLSAEAINIAKRAGARLELPPSVEFHCQDCSTFSFDSPLDVVMMIDFLEHIEEPGALLQQLSAIVSADARLLISVPTHRYPLVFGKAFHEEVGHVHDGFDATEMSTMLEKAGFQIDAVSYNTGPIGGFACRIYYGAFAKPSPIKNMAGFALSLLRWVDVVNGPHSSSSMFVVASKAAR
jgi:SAM-dependent methyltransferase